MPTVENLGSKGLEALGLSPAAEAKLKQMHEELADAYREQFMALLATVNDQATSLRRIQETLNLLVQHVAPHIKLDESLRVPVAVNLSASDDLSKSDLATALVIADPIGAGYTMSQSDVAAALAPNVSQPDVSILVRAFKLNEDENCAVTVRKGHGREMVNYHRRTVDKLRTLIASPPKGKQLKPHERSALDRVRRRMLAPAAPSPK